MLIKSAVGAALIGLVLGAMPSAATENSSESLGEKGRPAFAAERGKALPPIGFVRFCAANPDECSGSFADPGRLVMSAERWSLVLEVNSYVNSKIAPVSDQDLYGEAERWAIPTDAGDCEDYVLLKKRYLEGLGFPAEALPITVLLDEKGEGHAVLTLLADSGDFVLDNRRDEVLRWNETHYRFLKRQSSADPRAWVALDREKPSATGFISGGNK